MKRVVVLDGGGVRGLFPMKLFIHVEEDTKKSILGKCDLVVGSSVGALVGAALVTGLLDRPETRMLIEHLAPKVFEKINPKQPLLAPKFYGAPKLQVLKEIFGARTMAECLVPLVVVSADFDGRMKLWKSWIDKSMLLATVLDASSAAPTYFRPVRIGDKLFIDGGVQHNTPLIPAEICVKELFPNADVHFLSIGCRTPSIETSSTDEKEEDLESYGLLKWINKGILDVLMGVNDDSAVQLIRSRYGENRVLRLTANVPPCFDNTSPEFLNILKQEASRVFAEHRDVLETFFQ